MTAIGSFATDIGEQYQDIEKLAFDQISNLVGVHNHHLEYGHDLEGMMEAFQIDGVPGIKDWFKEMAQSFVTPDGIPFPYAEALQQATGMSAHQAVEWLSANIVDAAEMGAEAVVMSFFRKNPKAYSICLVLGIAFGLYNDNPLLVAMNGLLYFNKLRREGRLKKGLWNSTDRFLRTSFSVVYKVGTTTFVADTALHLVGVSLSDLAEHLATAWGVGGKLTKTAHLALDAATAGDIVDGIANLGLSLVVGKMVGKIVEAANRNVKEEIERLEPLVESRRRLLELIKNQAPPETLAPLVELMGENGIYQPILS